MQTMTYKENGSRPIQINIQKGESYAVLNHNNISRKIGINCFMIPKIKDFFREIGLTDLSGIRSRNILNLIEIEQKH